MAVVAYVEVSGVVVVSLCVRASACTCVRVKARRCMYQAWRMGGAVRGEAGSHEGSRKGC